MEVVYEIVAVGVVEGGGDRGRRLVESRGRNG